MCRSIKKLRNPDYFPDNEEIHAAALQYIRKVSGYRQPSKRNKAVFEKAVSEVAVSTQTLLENLQQLPVQK
jgi:hypothetical protein